jgi:hypothetical protein
VNAKTTSTALRVLATAAEQGLLIDRPSCLDVYGAELAPTEVRWLLDGMPDAQLTTIPNAQAGGEDMQLVGTLVGRVVRVLLVSRRKAGLIGDLAARAVAAHAKAGAR